MTNTVSALSSEAVEDLSAIPALLAEISEALGTSDMSLDEMVVEMRRIRESSNYEALA